MTPPTIKSDPTISAPVIGLYNTINPISMATKGSRFDKMEAFEALTNLILLFQTRLAIPCTTTAVMINKAQSEKLGLIRKGESSKKANGIATKSPTIFEYNVIVSGSVLLDKSLVIIIIIANVIIVRTIQIRPLSI